jgi:hypothetical protein
VRKLALASIIFCVAVDAMAKPIVVEIKAVANPYQTHPNVYFDTKSMFYMNIWNNTNIRQSISVVYNHCVDGGGCVSGEDVINVEPKSLFSKEYSLTLTGCQYGIGLYQDRASMDVRIDSIGKHYYAYGNNFIRSS